MTKISEKKEKIHIEILVLLKDAQQQHGLRHKDYQSYHQYISKKLHRMRKSLNFQQGKGNRVVPKKITRSMLSDSRFILLKLFEVERAWAFSMQLKAESNNDHRKKYHMRSRLKKALTLSKELWELCKWDKCDEHPDVEACETCAPTDAHTYVEAQAYYYNMQAIYHFEFAEWRKAKIMFEKAFIEYSGLAKAVDKDHESIYSSKTDEISPLVKYCANNAGELMNSSDGVNALEAAGNTLDQYNDLIKQIYQNQVAIITEVNWLGMVIPVKQENVKLAVLALKDTNIELSKSTLGNDAKIKMYDSLLKTVTDAVSVVRDDLKSSGVTNPTQITNQSIDNLSRMQILFVYLHYVKLVKTIERNLVIIESNVELIKSTKPQNIARLYDTVVQNLQELSGLPGLNSETNSLGNISDNLEQAQLELQAKIRSYKAFRCYYLSQAHLIMKRYTECSALLERSLRHCSDARNTLNLLKQASKGSSLKNLNHSGVCVNDNRLIPGPNLKDLEELTIRGLIETVQADQLICRAQKCLEKVGADNDNQMLLCSSASSADKADKKTLFQRMNEFQLNEVHKNKNSHLRQSLVEFPPDFESVPVKPVFFDLAYYHVELPNLDDKLRDPKKTEAKGLTGLVKGWIWGSK